LPALVIGRRVGDIVKDISVEPLPTSGAAAIEAINRRVAR